MGVDSRELRRLIDNPDNPYLRCIGFLCIRFGLPPDQLWAWLGEYVLDDEERDRANVAVGVEVGDCSQGWSEGRGNDGRESGTRKMIRGSRRWREGTTAV